MYGSWGAGVVARGDQSVKGGYVSSGEGTVGGIRTSEGGTVLKGQNNTYVGKDGDVYRRGESGWEKYDNGGWSPVRDGNAGRPSQQPAQGLSREQGAVADRVSGNVPAASDRSLDNANRTNTGSGRESFINELNRESADRSRGEQRSSQYNRQYGGQQGAMPHAGGRRR